MPSDENLKTAPKLDDRDAAAMREPFPGANGTLRHAISDAFVSFYKDYFGKGPTKCRTVLAPNLIVVVMRGGFTPLEQTLVDAGRWREVRATRLAWQEAMEDRFKSKVEELTGRSVEAFMSASHESPEVTIEAFTLEPNDRD